MSEFPLATVGALVVSPLDNILIIKTHKWKNKWGVPGGKIDYSETIKDALIREFKEETKLELTDIHWGPVQEAVQSPEFYKSAHFILLNFIARSNTENVVLNDEAQAHKWLKPKEALTHDLNKPTRNLIRFYLAHGFTTESL